MFRVRSVPQTDASTPWPRWRVVLIRIWAGLLTVVMLLWAQWVLRLGSAADGEHFMYAGSSVFKLLSLGGAAWVMWTGGRSVAAYWMIGVGQVVWAVTSVVAPQVDAQPRLDQLLSLLLFYGPLVLLRPDRKDLLRPRFQPDALLCAVAVVWCAALVTQAWLVSYETQLAVVRFDAVALYLTIGAMMVLAALRPAGSRWLPWPVAAAGVATGCLGIGYPDDVYSPGTAGGILLVVMSLAFLAVAERANRSFDTVEPADAAAAAR
jgi:hypothetical protein